MISEEARQAIRGEVAQQLASDVAKHREFVETLVGHAKWGAAILFSLAGVLLYWLIGQSLAQSEERAEYYASEIALHYKLDKKLVEKLDERVMAAVDAVDPMIQERVGEAADAAASQELSLAVAQALEDLKGQVEADGLSDYLLPLGTILPWIGGAPPTGWLICNEANSRATQGKVPNLEMRFLMGVASASESGRPGAASTMALAGRHLHGGDANYNLDVLRTREMGGAPVPRESGWLLTDQGSDQGNHRHSDDNIPAHFTVAYIMRVQ